MPTTYRACVITNSVRTQGMLQPSFTREFKRDSVAALEECQAAFLKMLADNIPCGGARAWFERTDNQGRKTTLARYGGSSTDRDSVSGRETAGTWVFEEGYPGTASGAGLCDLPDYVHAGTAPKGTP
jgi:hypothetical protein